MEKVLKFEGMPRPMKRRKKEDENFEEKKSMCSRFNLKICLFN